jgi:nucleoside-diphosphate-sugar epimerase
MRTLVTGAAGFIGSRLSHRLVAEGHDVVGFDDLSEGRLDNLSDSPEVAFVEADLRDDQAVAGAATGCDVIFHQAAKRSVPRSLVEPLLTTDVNVRGTLNVLEAARASGGRVVYASSSSVYGDQETLPLHEGMLPGPKSPYAATKLADEALAIAYHHSLRLPSVGLRYFNVYGPRQDPKSEYAAVVPRFITACLKETQPVIHGDGEQSRDFAFVDDVVEANLLASRAPDAALGRAFNVGGGGAPTSVNGLLAIVAELTGATPDPIHEPGREGDMRATQADLTQVKAALGWEPSVDIREGLRRTVEWFTRGAATDVSKETA